MSILSPFRVASETISTRVLQGHKLKSFLHVRGEGWCEPLMADVRAAGSDISGSDHDDVLSVDVITI